MLKIEMEMGSVKGISEDAYVALRPRLIHNMQRAVLILESSFKRVVGGPGGGRIYKRTKSGKMHRASAPCQPPARDMGDYVNSVGHEVDAGSNRLADIVGKVGSRLWNKRGKLLEHGTVRMRPRPHVDQSINAARDAVERVLGDM